MIKMSLDEIKEKILDQTDLKEKDIDEKISIKLEQLSGLISEEGAAHIVANELDVNLSEGDERLKISNLVSGMKGIDIAGRVVRKYELRTFENDKGKGQYAKFLLGDDSGITMVVLWGENAPVIEKLEEKDTVLLKNILVKEGRRGEEIHMGGRSEIDVNPEGVEVEASDMEQKEFTRKSIEDLEKEDEAELLVTIVQIFEPKYFERHPETKKKVTKNDDGEWETVDGDTVEEPDIGSVLNIYVDDGTDNMRVVLWKPQIKNLLDVDEEKLRSFRDDIIEFEDYKTEILGKMALLRGRVQENSVTEKLEFVARYVDADIDPEEIYGDDSDEDKSDSESDNKSDSKEDKDTSETKKEESKKNKEKSKKEGKSSEEDVEEDSDEDIEEEDLEEDVLSLEDLEDVEEEL